MMRSVVWSMSVSCGLNQNCRDCECASMRALDERRMRSWCLLGAPRSSCSYGSSRPEPEDSHGVEGASGIEVEPVAVQAGAVKEAVNRIAAAKNASRADEPFGNGALITSAETRAGCGRH
jgi:hypothetical protein